MKQMIGILATVVTLIGLGVTGYAVKQSGLDGVQNERIAVVETMTTESKERLVRIESKIDGLYDLKRNQK